MYERDAADEKRTAFRREEKRYQLHRDQTFLTRRNKKVGGPLVTRRTSLADALDSRDLRAVAAAGGGEHGVRAVALQTASDGLEPSFDDMPNGTAPREAYELASRPGCVVFPGALDVATQRKWLADAVTRLCEPPAATNHDAAHGPIKGLWAAATSAEPRWLKSSDESTSEKASRDEDRCWSLSPPPSTNGRDPRDAKTSASSLLRRLRWATLGPPYDWTTRTYRTDAKAFSVVPEDIVARCETLAAFAAASEFGANRAERGIDSDSDVGKKKRRFRFGAGLVNYYREGDALAGHVDDAERDLTKPIISFSLGSPCVFLLGGDTRDAKPTPLILRSGDAVALVREARRRFHGVPRVFTAAENARDNRGELLAAPRELSDPECWKDQPDVARYVAGARVNVSVRDID
jgi:alkylated DNA repair protein alkB family protein 1